MVNDGTTVIEWIMAIGTIATPILLIGISGVGWYLKSRLESSWKTEADLRRRAEKLEEAIREDRLRIYNDILEPFIILFTKDETHAKSKKGKTKDQRALEIIQSVEYRQAAFKLSLFADDNIVRAYNNLMQSSYALGSDSDAVDEQGIQLLSAFGDFLLEIRKGVGNESTSLRNLEMLRWMITDFDKLEELASGDADS